MKDTSSFGRKGEEAAAKYLKQIGYRILEMNFSNPSGRRLGEIDIIAQDKDEIVFVEVKTRQKKSTQILPEENITRFKLYKLNKAAAFYIQKKGLFECSYRFDAISVVADPDSHCAQLRHLKNIFY